MPSGGRSRAGARGFALILVLWVLVLLATIGTYILANARTETALARNIVAGAQAEALADSGVALAVFHLMDPVDARRWNVDGGVYAVSVSGGELTIRLGDESAKINPNFASEDLIASLFIVLGADPAIARRLGAATADWIDRDDKARPSGGEQKQYLDAGLNHFPANAPFESVDDLALVVGMTPSLLNAARPYLTIHTEVAAPDPRGAPLVVQRALTLAARGPRGGMSLPVSNVEPDAPEPVAPSRAAAPSPTAERPAIANVQATARSARGGVFVRRAVVRIEPDKPKGHVVLDWRQDDLVE